MKISGLQENLKQGLFTVSHIATKNINLPILNNILIEAKDGKIKLVATNLEIGITNIIRGKIEEEGSFTVDSKVLYDYINLLPNKKIDIRLEEGELTVKSDNYNTKIKGQSAEEFPLIPAVDKASYCGIVAEDFKKALAQTIFSASNNDARMELAGVLFVFRDKELIIAATDSYRLAEKKLAIKKSDPEQVDERRIIIPAKTLQELLRIISSSSGEDLAGEDAWEIKIYVSDNQVMFSYGSLELVSRLIEGHYPDYEQIIPSSSKTKCVVEKQDLVRAVKAASIFSKSGINDVNLDIPSGKNKAVISSASGQTGENISEIDANTDGVDNGVVMNYRYFLDGINAINTDRVLIQVIDSNTPCLLKPEKGDDYLYIIMPIKQ
jgi:DNA polymerase III subunit beta